MNDSLEARLAAMPEIEKRVQPLAAWILGVPGYGDCCVAMYRNLFGCTSDCLHSGGGVSGYYWHGTTAPTVETLISVVDSTVSNTFCSNNHKWWFAEPMHPRLALDFDEEAERARLMPV